MEYVEFKKALLSFGIENLYTKYKDIDINLHLINDKYYVYLNNKIISLASIKEFFNMKIINHKKIEDIFLDLKIINIDDKSEEEFLNFYKRFNNKFIFYLCNETNYDVATLKQVLLLENESGNVILYLGTNELKNIENEDFTLYLYMFYLNKKIKISSSNNLVTFQFLNSFANINKNEFKYGIASKNYKVKNERNEKLKKIYLYEKLKNKSYKSLYIICIILVFALIIISMSNIKAYRIIPALILLLFVFLIYGITKNDKKKIKKLNVELNIENEAINYSNTFKKIYNEMNVNKFKNLKAKLNNKNISYAFKNNKIVLKTNNNLAIIFNNHYVLIQNTINEKIVIVYYKEEENYLELENRIIKRIDDLNK